MKYRITKYNPLNRDEMGRYIVDEWISLYDVGRIFNGNYFTLNEYLQVENNYINVFVLILKYFKIEKLLVFDLEKYISINKIKESLKTVNLTINEAEIKIYNQISNGYSFDIVESSHLFRMILKEMIWCRLKDRINNNKLLIQFGYDYYSYVSCSHLDNKIITNALEKGIYIEPLYE